jgi:hypothetical protein
MRLVALKHQLIPVFFIAVILSLTLLCCSKQPLSEQARLSIKPPTADFGTIDANDPVVFRDVTLTVTNLGKEPLTIEHFEFPKGFTYFLVPSNTIQTGKTATLRITIDLRQFSGKVSEAGYLRSNDPDQPRLQINLEASIVGERTGQVFQVGDEPDIEFDHKAFNMGTVSRNQTVEHHFTFKNVGRKPLKIFKIETTCSCFSGRPTRPEVPAGGSAAIIATLEAFKYEGTRPEKMLIVSTNDPDEPAVNLNVRASIIDAAILDPPAVILPNIRSGQGASAEVMLIEEGAQALVIENIKTSSPHITVTTSPLEGEQKGYLLTVTVDPDMPEEMFDEVVTIITNYGDYSETRAFPGEATDLYRNYATMELPVQGSVTGLISIIPKKLNFGFHAPGSSVQRKLALSALTPDFQIKAVSVNDQSFRVSYSPLEAGKTHEIAVEFLAGPDEQQIEDELTIITTSGKIVVPLFAGVQSQR